MIPIDLRSDTVTKPTPAMREAMANAPVGNDEYGEDPTINALQERVAGLLGKEAALWTPSGIMANQIALRVLTQPGDDVIVSQESHAKWHEMGASAVNSGVQFTEIGAKGVFSASECEAAIHPRGHILYAPTTLVEVENTHNRAGGVIFPQDEIVQICQIARQHGVNTYLDGARLWNVSVATGTALDVLAEPFDLVMVALSKGMGAPAGSMLAGSKETITRATRARRMLGGTMRQIGMLGAAALHAIEHHFERLADDHANAQKIATRLAQSSRIEIDLERVHTNILVFHLKPGAPDAVSFGDYARERGVLIFPTGPRTIRAVTHLDVTAEQCEQAADIFVQIAEEG